MFCYSNNGLSMRAVDVDYIAQEGEILFSDYATSDELSESFSGYSVNKNNEDIKFQIAALEAYQNPRLLRGVALGLTTPINNPELPFNGMTPTAALDYIEVHIAALRSQII